SVPRAVSTATTSWPRDRNARNTCAPLAMETSRSSLVPPSKTAIFIRSQDQECPRVRRVRRKPRTPPRKTRLPLLLRKALHAPGCGHVRGDEGCEESAPSSRAQAPDRRLRNRPAVGGCTRWCCAE